jgi:predicted cupin superfamily sugar epimerase
MTDDFATRTTKDGEFIETVARPATAVALGLEPHPEGGWYRRTWASGDTLELVDADGTTRRRPAGTLILFLLPAGEASAWHRVASTEIWITNGTGVVALELGGSGDAPVTDTAVALGTDVAAGQTPQYEIPADVWQRTLPAAHDALVSCLVSPGFDFADFTLE